MKKLISLLLFTLTCWAGHAQTLAGNQQAITVKTAAYGATENALMSLPDDYNTTTQRYPLIIFLHGVGEVGSKPADLSKLLNAGLPKVIKNGVKIQAVNPTDGKTYKFIVICPQHWAWTTEPANLDYMLADLLKTYRIDADRIYLTGLSAGGQGVVQATTYSQSLTNKIAAIVPMSPAAPSTDFTRKFAYFREAKTGAWFFSGASKDDPYQANAKAYSDSINKYNPGSSRVTITNSLNGHCCWDVIYNPSHKENGLNIYEWMLTYTRGGQPAPPAPPADTILKDYQICVGNARDIQKIIVLLKSGKYVQYDSSNMTIPNVKVEVQ